MTPTAQEALEALEITRQALHEISASHDSLVAELKLARDHRQGFEADCKIYENEIAELKAELHEWEESDSAKVVFTDEIERLSAELAAERRKLSDIEEADWRGVGERWREGCLRHRAEIIAQREQLRLATEAIEKALTHLNATTPNSTFSVAVYEVEMATRSLRGALAQLAQPAPVQKL